MSLTDRTGKDKDKGPWRCHWFEDRKLQFANFWPEQLIKIAGVHQEFPEMEIAVDQEPPAETKESQGQPPDEVFDEVEFPF